MNTTHKVTASLAVGVALAVGPITTADAGAGSVVFVGRHSGSVRVYDFDRTTWNLRHSAVIAPGHHSPWRWSVDWAEPVHNGCRTDLIWRDPRPDVNLGMYGARVIDRRVHVKTVRRNSEC